MRLNNIVFNVLGYIPLVSIVSGTMRICVGVGIVGYTMAVGDRNAQQGAIIGRWYDEALSTGIAQIARGILEVIPLCGIVNLMIDVVATPFNLSKEVVGSLECAECMSGGRIGHGGPHADIAYPTLLKILYLV